MPVKNIFLFTRLNKNNGQAPITVREKLISSIIAFYVNHYNQTHETHLHSNHTDQNTLPEKAASIEPHLDIADEYRS